MAPTSLQFSSEHRAMLVEFERLHARWRAATDAAGPLECGAPVDDPGAEQVLRHSLEADAACRRAMQLLRDAPL